jgi:hypothetical protein
MTLMRGIWSFCGDHMECSWVMDQGNVEELVSSIASAPATRD